MKNRLVNQTVFLWRVYTWKAEPSKREKRNTHCFCFLQRFYSDCSTEIARAQYLLFADFTLTQKTIHIDPTDRGIKIM